MCKKLYRVPSFAHAIYTCKTLPHVFWVWPVGTDQANNFIYHYDEHLYHYSGWFVSCCILLRVTVNENTTKLTFYIFTLRIARRKHNNTINHHFVFSRSLGREAKTRIYGSHHSVNFSASAPGENTLLLYYRVFVMNPTDKITTLSYFQPVGCQAKQTNTTIPSLSGIRVSSPGVAGESTTISSMSFFMFWLHSLQSKNATRYKSSASNIANSG
jgi:hypothetical protein